MRSESQETKDVQTFFHSYAEGFDAIYGHTDRRSAFGRWIDQRFRQSMYLRFRDTLENVRPDEIRSVLDIGCGPGRYCVEFLKMGKRVTAIDIAEGMIDLARGLCAREAPDGDIRFLTDDYLNCRLPEPHEAAVLMGFFDYIADPAPVLDKLRGDATRLIVASFPKTRGLYTLQRKIRYRLRNCPLYFYTPADVARLCEGAGFGRFEITEYDRDLFVRIEL